MANHDDDDKFKKLIYYGHADYTRLDHKYSQSEHMLQS